MKNILSPLLLAGSLALIPCGGFAQVAKAPAAPPAPGKPAPPAPPPDGLTETIIAATQEAQRAAREAVGQASGFSQRLQNVITRVAAPNGALVIPKNEAEAKSVAATEEDLNIMAHILEKVPASPDRKGRRAMGIPVRAPGNGVPQNIYLDGYGAIFFLNVNYPLSAPPQPAAPAEAKAEPSEWDEARRELYQPPQPTEMKWETDFKGELFGIGGAAEPYDEEKVEALQNGLIGALNNASHIRSLKDHETVTIVVKGRATAGNRVYIRKSAAGNPNGGGGFGGGGGSSSSPRAGTGQSNSGPFTIEQAPTAPPADRGNTLVIRADKESIDAFAKDKLSLDEFRKKVTTFVY
jgi:hypothetical protein